MDVGTVRFGKHSPSLIINLPHQEQRRQRRTQGRGWHTDVCGRVLSLGLGQLSLVIKGMAETPNRPARMILDVAVSSRPIRMTMLRLRVRREGKAHA